MKALMPVGRALLWIFMFASSPLLALSGVTRWENTFHQSLSGAASQSVLAARELADGTTLTVMRDGSGMTTLRYDHTGVLQSSATCYPIEGAAFALIDPFGGVFFATQASAGAGYEKDLWFTKFDGLTGNPLWPAAVIYGGGNHQDDSFMTLLVDAGGNLVVGATDETNSALAVLKYDGVTGGLIWGPAITVTQGHYAPVTLDASGDVYIAHRTGSGTSSSFHLTRRSAATGAVVWQLDEAGHELEPGMIVIDGSGNLVAVGNAPAPGGSIEADKYSGMFGQRIWGPAKYAAGDLTDAVGAAVGPDGSAFVYGVVANGNQVSDFVLKFRGADGALEWGPVPVLSTGQDVYEASLVVAGNGDVVVSALAEPGQSVDAKTWRFGGADGHTVWGPQVITDGYPGPLFVASDGHVFLAASVSNGTSSSAQVMELDGATGLPSWGPTLFAGTAAGFAHLWDLTSGPDGNVVATGMVEDPDGTGSWATIKYDRSTGSVLWGPVKFPTGLSPLAASPWQVLTNASGDVLVAGLTVGGMTVVKYSGSTGAQLWASSPSPQGTVSAFALDPGGNPIVSGYLSDGSGNYDAVTVKFSGTTGAPIWGPIVYDSGSGDFPDHVASDSSGNVIVIGHSTTEPPGFLLKYAALDGSVLWGPSTFEDYATWLAVDAAGDIFQVGYGPGITTNKFSGATGALLWGPLLVGDASTGYGVALALDAAGDVFVTGSLSSPATFADYAVIKYRGSDGAVLWGPVTYDGGGKDYPYGVVVDGLGNAVVTGTSDAGSGEYRTATLSYDGTNGAPRWGPVGQNIARDSVNGLAASGSTVYVGATWGNFGYLVTALDETLGIETGIAPLPAGSCGHAVDVALGALNGTPPYSWSVTSGALPPGVALGSDGHVAGVPTEEGNYGFRARVQDSAAHSASRDFTLVVGPGSALVPIALAEDDVSCQLTLSVSGSYAGYAWQPGGQATPTIQVNPTEPTTYGVVLDDGSTCSVRGAVTIAPLDPDCVVPRVDAISPEFGPTGRSFLVSGNRFVEGATLSIGGVPVTDVVFESVQGLEGHVPVLTPGSVDDLLVINPDGRYGIALRRFAADFLDVTSANPFYTDIMIVDRAGITAGCGGGNYCPGAPVSRAQMAVFLLKAEHGFFQVPPPCTGVFADVACPGGFAVDWIEQLAAEGITGGCGGGNYCPDAAVTRAQMSAFLLKAQHGSSYVPPPCTGVFGDVPCGSPFADWIEQLFHESITSGCGGNDYCPNSPNTRAQMAVFVAKTFGLQ